MAKTVKKLSIKKISIFIILVLIIIIVPTKLHSKKVTIPDKKDNDIKPTEIIQKPKEYELALVMVGDALINDNLYNDANKIANYNGYDFKPYLKLIKKTISSYDLAYYNQETILGGTSIGLSSYPSFNSPTEVGDAMIDAGFNLVSLATNHTLDRGEKAVLSSRSYWNNQKDVYAFGSYSSFSEKETLESKIFEKNNIKYAILNYTYGLNGIPLPSGKEYLVNLWGDNNYESYKETVLKNIKAVRDKVDILIVAMHWGIEYTHTPTARQREEAKFLADNGVDIIIGTHPHVIEPVEWIDDTIVFYSLGNFLSAQTSSSCSNYKCNIGLMSSLKITKTIDDDKINIKIDNIQNDLIYMYHNNYKDYLIIPFSDGSIKDYLANYKEVYDNYASIIASKDNRIKTVPLGS